MPMLSDEEKVKLKDKFEGQLVGAPINDRCPYCRVDPSEERAAALRSLDELLTCFPRCDAYECRFQYRDGDKFQCKLKALARGDAKHTLKEIIGEIEDD